MKLIERYVYAVMEYLPFELREDIGKELHTNIEDMLPDDYTEEEVYQVLVNLGSPLKLASEYNSQKRYVIGPGYYEQYISMLKMVIGICVSVTLGIAALVWILEFNDGGQLIENISKLIGTLISAGIEGALQGAFWVTLVFVILERSGVEAGYLPFFNKEWTPDDLSEESANDKLKISRGETIFTMCATILFTALIYVQPQLIAFYTMEGKGRLTISPLFNLERLDFYLPILLILAFIQLALSVWKYIAKHWSLPLIIMNAVYNTVISILIIVLMNDITLFNSGFTQAIGNVTKASSLTISNWLTTSKWIFILVFIGICVWDSTIIFVRYLRKSKI